MARLFTTGFETQTAGTTSANLFGESNLSTGGVTGQPGSATNFTLDTSVVRSGAASARCLSSVNGYLAINGALTALDRAYFVRFYFRTPDATPTTGTDIVQILANAVDIARVAWNTNGTLTLIDANATQIGSASAALVDNTWHRIDVKLIIPTAGAGTLEARLDRTVFATSAAADVNNSVASAPVFRLGQILTASGSTAYLDDVAINDDQGASQNSYPTEGKVVVLWPVSDSAIGTWVGPQTTGDDTASLYDNVDNRPPTGTSLAAGHDVDANAGKYAFNITNSAAQNFDVTTQTFTAAGVGSSDSVRIAQALVRASVDSTTGVNTIAVQGVSNPAITAATGGNLETGSVAGAEPTGWKTFKTSPVYDPSVTKGTGAVIRATKEVASTRVTAVDLMGLQVEYEPPVVHHTLALDDALTITDAVTPVLTERRWDASSDERWQEQSETRW